MEVDWLKWVDGTQFDVCNGTTIDKFGNVFVTGESQSPSFTINGVTYTNSTGTKNAFILKFSASGDIIWFKWISGANTEYGRKLACDSNGNLYMAGDSNSPIITIDTVNYAKPGFNVNDNPGNPNTGGYVLKINTIGAVEWFKWIDGANNDSIVSILVDKYNQLYVLCNTSSPSLTINGTVYTHSYYTSNFSFVIKLNAAGNTIWFKWLTAYSNSIYSINSASDNLGNVYLIGKGSNFQNGPLLVAGITANYFTYNSDNGLSNNDQQVFIMKINNNGAVEWVKWIEGSGTHDGFSIDTDGMGNIAVLASTSSSQVYLDAQIFNKPTTTGTIGFVAKLNTYGKIQWLKWIDSNGFVGYNKAIFDNNDNIYVAANTGANILQYEKETTNYIGFLLKLNSFGKAEDLQWIDGYDNVNINDISIDSTTNFVICGSTPNTIIVNKQEFAKPSSGYGGFIIKLDRSYIKKYNVMANKNPIYASGALDASSYPIYITKSRYPIMEDGLN